MIPLLTAPGPAGHTRPRAAVATTSFDQIWADHHRWAVRLATHLTGDQHVAEDVVADVFVRLHRRLGRGPVDQPRAYLRRAIVNERTSWLRRTSRDLALRMAVGRERPARPAPTDAVVDRDPVLQALHRLTERQRTVVVLRHYEQLSVEEVAAALGVSHGTVKTTTHRALARMGDLLGGDAR